MNVMHSICTSCNNVLYTYSLSYRGASDEFTASTETQLSQYAEETLIIRPDVRGSDINTVYYYSLIIV